MIDIRPEKTNLPIHIFAVNKSYSEEPIVKLSPPEKNIFNTDECRTFYLDKEKLSTNSLPGMDLNDIKQVVDFIDKNRNLFLEYWDEKLSGAELIQSLVK